MNNSIKLKRRLTQTPYLYLIGLSIVIIYPLLITIMSAFKAGNVAAFKLDTNIDFNFDNFKGLFTETLYGAWYPQYLDHRLSLPWRFKQNYHRTCWLCLQPLQLLGS